MGLQECFRTVCVEKNINGCNGYKLESGVGYIVKVFNDDLGRPNMSDKPMKSFVKRKTPLNYEAFLLKLCLLLVGKKWIIAFMALLFIMSMVKCQVRLTYV